MKKGLKNDDIRLRQRPYAGIFRFRKKYFRKINSWKNYFWKMNLWKMNFRKMNFPVMALILINIGIMFAFGSEPKVSTGLFPGIYDGRIPRVSAAVREDSDTVTESGPVMTVHYGYDQYVKYGRYMNVTATISNNNREFNGWLQVIVPKSKNNVVYRREVSIAPKETKNVSINLPVMDDTGFMQVKLENNNGNTVVEKTYELKIGNYEKLAYTGILSDEKEKLDYISDFGTRTFYLDENTLPDDYLALDLLDIIIINHFDTGRLSEKQLEAIEKWVMNGGTLVIGTGEYEKETLSELRGTYSIESLGNETSKDITFGMDRDSLAELKQDLVDYEEERKVFLEVIKDRNEMLTAYGNKPIVIDNAVFEEWSKNKINGLKLQKVHKYITDVTLKGSSIIASEDGYNLMQSSPMGLGRVQLFGFDMGLSEDNRTISLSILNEICKNMSNTKLTQLEEEYYGSYLNYGVYNSMSYTDAKKVPKVARYIFLLGAYICIIGPVTYIILRKCDKRSLTWAAVPLTAVIFTLLVYAVGSDTRINEPYAGYVKLLNFQKDSKVNEEFYFSLTAPYNHSYSVPIERNYSIAELRGNADSSYLYDYKKKEEIYYDNYITAINYGTQSTVLEVKNNPAFSPVYYQWAASYDMPNQLDYDIHYAGDKVYGTVTNGFNFDITNAMLTSDGYVINIGEIKKGETVSLEGKDAIFMTTRDELYNTDIINQVAGGTGDVKDNTVEINRLSNVLYYLTENNLLNNQHNSCIIGFVRDSTVGQDSSNNLLGELTKDMKAYGTTAVKLPVDVDYTSGNKVFVPSMDPYMIMSEGYYNKYYQSRYLSSDNMTIKYHLPDADNILSFEYLSTRNQDSSSDYLSAFDGDIYFLNNKTGDYDEVFTEGAGSSVTDIENYLTEQNTITVRYSTKMSLKGYQMVLPYISYWKEADSNAGN